MYTNIIIVGTGKIADTSMMLALEMRTLENVCVYEYLPSQISMLKKRAEKENVHYEVFYEKSDLTQKLININQQTLIISANNIYIFTKELCDKEEFTIINYHSSLLPKYAGMNATTWAIYHGENEGGITWHYVDAQIDHGRILKQKKCAIEKDMTALQLNRRYDALATEALKELLPPLLQGQTPCQPTYQDMKYRSVYRTNDIPDDGFLDIEKGTAYCYRVLRSMDYGVFSIFSAPILDIEGEKYCVEKYQFSDDAIEKETVVSRQENVVKIGDKDGTLMLWIKRN